MHNLVDGDIIWIDANGYERSKCGYVHRAIAERVLGRKLLSKEQVHHVNEIRSDNRNDNLVICPDQKYHKLLHANQRIVDLGGHPTTHKYCSYHKTLHLRSEFSYSLTVYDGLHNNCRKATNTYRKDKGLNCNKFNWKERLNQQYRRIFSKHTNREISKI